MVYRSCQYEFARSLNETKTDIDFLHVSWKIQIHIILSFLYSEEVDQKYPVKNDILKYLAKFTEKHMCWGLFLLKWQKFCNRHVYVIIY